MGFFEKIESLSELEVDAKIVELVGVERRHEALMIAHLAEMQRRKLHLVLGYRNLFAYCVERLNLGEGSTRLRMQVAGCCRRFPQILRALAASEISLTVAGRIAPHVNEGNCEKILDECAGMTRVQVEKYLVALKPKPEVSSGYEKRPDAASATNTEGGLSFGENQNEKPSSTADETTPPACAATGALKEPSSNRPNGRIEAATVQSNNHHFSAPDSFRQKLERVAECLGFHDVKGNQAELLERGLDCLLDRIDPQRKLERRRAREARKAKTEKDRPADVAREKEPSVDSEEKEVTRYVPVAMQDRVRERAGHQCEYVGLGGVRCDQRTGLEIHHVEAWAKYRRHEEDKLKCYCKPHNLLEAEQELGVEFIRDKMRERVKARWQGTRESVPR